MFSVPRIFGSLSKSIRRHVVTPVCRSMSVTPAEEEQPPRKPLIEHAFIRFECYHGRFETKMTISLPDTTSPHIVEGTRQALAAGLKDRPDGLDYHYDRLPEPQFVQNGDKWNRYMYSLKQREVYGSIDFYTLQAIVLDKCVNDLDGRVVSSTSALSDKHTEVYSYVLQFPHASTQFDYYGSYKQPEQEDD